MLQKTMVVVEGRRPHARSQARHVEDGGARGARLDRAAFGTGRQAQDAGAGLGKVARAAFALPDLVSRSERALQGWRPTAERGLQLAPESIERIGNASARRSRPGHVALWVIAALLAVIAFKLL